MNTKQIKNELWQIALRFPTLGGLLQKQAGNTTIGHVWAETIRERNLDPDHFSNVCYEYAMAEREMPQPQDQLLYCIIEEAKDRAYKDQAKWEQHQKYHDQKRQHGVSKEPWYQWMHKLIDQKEPLPADKLEELIGWCVWGKPKPEWVE